MIAKDIIKALECCCFTDDENNCCTCPLSDNSGKLCVGVLVKNALDLINRQQEEIERLKEDRKRLKKVQMQLDDLCIMHRTIRAEAIKEFADKLKEKYKYHELCGYEVINGELDDLVKEMVGEE